MDLRERENSEPGIEGIVSIERIELTPEELKANGEEPPKEEEKVDKKNQLDPEEIFVRLDRHPDEIAKK